VEKIKVFHVVTLLELGGAQQNTLFTVSHLNRDKFEVGLICGLGGYLDEEAKKIPQLKVYFVNELVRPIHPLNDFIALIKIYKILKKEGPQIVHTHSSKAGIVGRIAAWLLGVPCIIHSIHGFGFNPFQKIWTRKLFIFLEKWIGKFTERLIAVTKENIQEGLSLGIGKAEQYTLIRSGVDIKKIKKEAENSNPELLRKELGISPQSKIILNVAPFKIQKDPVTFIKMAGLVLQNIPQVQFLMVGDGELRTNIEKEIKKQDIEKNIQLLGWRRDIPQILQISDLFVLTSLWEGLPRAAVEALIVGNPVIAFAVDGLKEIIKNNQNGFLIPPSQVNEMAEKIVQILQDQSLLQSLKKNASQTIDDSFDIYNMVIKQEELYQKLTRITQ